MATEPDPYRTLGLSRGASLDEVKRAYRRLAKANHPDAAGEAALPRFLAIQAAYDQIAGPGSASAAAARRAAPRQPWDADPTRADATRRAYGGRSRRARPTGSSGSTGGTGSAGPGGTSGSAGASDAAGASASDQADGSTGRSGSGRSGRPSNKATLGSTSYDGAEAEPFEPDWGGASWYGTTSGTYWTLNPKEYADPRKHGPEYQARARRAAAKDRAGRPAPDTSGSTDADPGVRPPTTTPDPPPTSPPTRDPAAAGPPPPPSHTTTSWWEATAGEPTSTAPGAPGSHGGDATAAPPPQDPETGARAGTPDPAGPRPSSWLDPGATGLPLRVGRAVLGWAPIALGIGWLAGEVTGCSRFAADCDAASAPIAWFAQVVVLGLLLLVPRLGVVTSMATLAALAAAVPAALILTATGRSATGGEDLPTPPTAGPLVLGGVILIAWFVGLAAGILRETRHSASKGPAGPVS